MIILLILIASVGVGLLLRRVKQLRYAEKTATWTVWALVFVLGVSLGGNNEVVSDFARFGISALIIALAGVGGSVFAAWCISGYIDKNKRK